MTRLALILALLAGGAGADPTGDLRPVARPALAQQVSTSSVRLVRPEARPDDKIAEIILARAIIIDAATKAAVRSSLRPIDRPEAILAMGRRIQRERRAGAVCGNLQIQGDRVGGVPGRVPGCGVSDAVRIRSVAGVALSQPATIDCPTADALYRWVEQSVKPTLRTTGGGISSLRVAAHYSCRTRNNQPGGRISEHGKGRAIDISGFILRDGSEITLLQGWRSQAHGAKLRQMHRDACGPFGTVLGPESDRFHQDHFHFDTARYRSGSYCR